VKGKVKEVAGELSDNPRLKTEANDEKIACLCFNIAKIALNT
jgi:uncharacterized protein YjbJ (UPF0337 family)